MPPGHRLTLLRTDRWSRPGEASQVPIRVGMAAGPLRGAGGLVLGAVSEATTYDRALPAAATITS
jgi:hypothetical protein